MAQSKVCLVVPLYINHPSLYAVVGRFFDSLDDHYPEMDLLVIDDASPLPHDFPVFERHTDNQGFTATINDGITAAFTVVKADITIVANDDLFFHAGDLDRFFALDPTKPIIASPMDTSATPDERFGAIWGITRAAWNLLGPLDARYRHFYSDSDYLYRARAKKVEIIKWRDIVIDHVESATYKNEPKHAMLEKDQAEFRSQYENNSNGYEV